MTRIGSRKQSALKLLADSRGDAAVEREFFKIAKGLDILDDLIEAGYFGHAEVPGSELSDDGERYIFSYWPPLDYLKRAAAECSEVNDHRAALKITAILRDVTENIDDSKKSNSLVWDGFSEILASLPVESITTEDIDQVHAWLSRSGYTGLSLSNLGSKLLKRILASGARSSGALALSLLEQLTALAPTGTVNLPKYSRGLPEFLGDSFWVAEALKKSASEIGSRLGLAGIQCLAARLSQWLEQQEENTPSYFFRPAIEDHEQNKTHDLDASSILLVALRDSCVSCAENNSGVVGEILEYLLSLDGDLFLRLAIFISDRFYEKCPDKIWENSLDQLTGVDLTHEFYHFLKHRFGEMSAERQSQIIQFIENYEVEDEDAEKKVLHQKSFKLRWLSALKGHGLEHVDGLFDRLREENGYEHENPDFHVYFSSGWIGEETPKDALEISAMTISEIVELLMDFKPEENWKSPSARGLKESLQAAVKNSPERYIEEIDRFSDCYPIYWAGLVAGFEDYWKETKSGCSLDWKSVFDFVSARFEESEVWYDQADTLGQGVYEPWENKSFLRAVMRLIKTLVENDDHAIENAYIPELRMLISAALSFTEMVNPEGRDDLLNSAINEPRGYVIDALISYSLHVARKSVSDTGSNEEAWIELKELYDAELAKCDGKNYEFSAIITSRLSNIAYLSQDWVFDNLSSLFNPNHPLNWRAAMDGYSYYGGDNSRLEERLFELGVYSAALKDFAEKSRVRDRLLERLTSAYLWERQELQGECDFASVIDGFEYEDVSHIIWFLWASRVGLFGNDKVQERVFALWELVLDRLDKEAPSGRKLLSDLNQLASFVTDLDRKLVDWLNLSAPYVHENFHSNWLVEELSRLVEAFPKEVGEVYLAMMEGYQPTYPDQKIAKIVDVLAKSGELVAATEIKGLYMKMIGWEVPDYEQEKAANA